MTKQLKLSLCGCACIVAAATLIGHAAQAGGDPNSYRITWDDFRDGFDASSPSARWFYFAAGPFAGDDGVATTGKSGLVVVPTGTNPVSGEPAFTKTLGQEDDNGGLPGGLDHVKWLVYANHLASTGFPGFDAAPDHEVACEAWVAARTFGTNGHPFGGAVGNPDDDLRLSAVGMNTIDFESFMVFDFLITNQTIYAIYERLPFGRPGLGNYAAFTFNIPVQATTPGQSHQLAVAYDKSAGRVRWIVDGNERFSVARIGHLLDRRYLTIDHGGTPTMVAPNQLSCGMGMFTLLDAEQPSGTALVRLSSVPGFYFDPDAGEPVPQTFLDNESLAGNRLFGQGAEIRVKKYVVSSRRTN